MEIVRNDGSRAFAYLLDAGFSGPDWTEYGIAFERADLHIRLSYYDWKHEREIATSVALASAQVHASLDCLYIACGCGPAQDIGGSAPSRLAVAKRVKEHAEGLRRVRPSLLRTDVEALLRRCQGRSLPDPGTK